MAIGLTGWSRNTLHRGVGTLGLPRGPGCGERVADAELACLPETARRYLRFMGVVERPREWSFAMESTGRFRIRPDGAWMECETWQYNSRVEVARVFLLTARFGPLMPLMARDSYLRGRGRMTGKLGGILTVANASGDELDQGELVTWVNDAVLFSPSMLIGPETEWSAVGNDEFDIAFTDHGRTVRARVTVDDRGAPVEFSTVDRHRYDPDRGEPHWIRERWTTPVGGWRLVGGRPMPSWGAAVWHTSEGEFAYAEFTPVLDSIRFNVPPPD